MSQSPSAGALGGLQGGAVAAMRRPRLRGWSHLGFVGPALAGTVVLVLAARGDIGRQLGLLVYGLSSVALFSVSGLYHVRTWTPHVRAALRRLDHATIFLLVSGTYTPVTLTLLGGAWRVAILATVWAVGAAGAVLVSLSLGIPRRILALLYVAQGWIAVIALPAIARSAGGGGLLLLIAGGALYSLGAVAYATRRPRLSPVWFGYHEVFHLLVIAANAMFFVFMVVEVVPHPH